MDSLVTILLASVAATAVMMLSLWIASLVKKDASIVDTFWGLGFVQIATIGAIFSPAITNRKILVAVLVAIWGIRLSLHIFLRNRGKGEDFRYKAMRERHGDKFPIVSLFTVFLFQGALMIIISLPLQVAQTALYPKSLSWLDYLGTAVWLTGFLFEAVADWQLKRFKSSPENKGKVLDSGLWRYSRHPNYFGESVVWWGYFLIALATPLGAWTIVSPLLMTLLLIKVSGVSLLEQTLVKTKPEYTKYIKSTSAFFPWLPKSKDF
ncbi:MAG: DUF1295 domain-containing protein [Acidobacteriota bacterium]|nr:DUF1295 domain-containing protein [Blastocatellia bacterium]MDW8411786.1 DUF1295 domain-containing protein [Acidobacteriota bacterium]